MSGGVKPCPLCNFRAYVETQPSEPSSEGDSGWRCGVVCRGCGLTGPTDKTPEGAIATWNRRPSEDAAYRAGWDAGRDAVVAWLRAEADVHAKTAVNAQVAGSSYMANVHMERANLLSNYADQVACIKPPATQEDPHGKAGR